MHASFLATMVCIQLEINHIQTKTTTGKTQTCGGQTTCYQTTNGSMMKSDKKHMETNENENTTVHNLWDTGKAGPGGK